MYVLYKELGKLSSPTLLIQQFWMPGNIGEGGHRYYTKLMCSPHIATVEDVLLG